MIAALKTEPLLLPDADARWFRRVFSPDETTEIFALLRRELDWRESHVRLFGLWVKSPRLSAWYGDASYTYSGLTWPAKPLPAVLADIRTRVEPLAGRPFNTVLANLYRDGRDSMGWHADDEPELGPDPVIASVVFGAARRFVFRRKSDSTQKIEVPLGDGDVLVMGAGCQSHWLHAVPKTQRPTAERINLTFRWIG